MYIHNITFGTPYTAEELAGLCVVHRQKAIPLTLEERVDGTLLFLGQPLSPEVFHVWFPPQPTQFGKQIPINGHCLFRAPETQDRWVCPSRFRKLTLNRAGERIDVLFFREEEPFVRWVRFAATDDPEAERPGDNPLSWKEEGGKITVLGASLYRERLHIPAQIHGLPVVRAELPHYRFSENLRELVVEEGVEQIAVDLFSPHLQVISIPNSVQLLTPPNGITRTRWFQDRPDGPVYFHGYFCGIKGETEEEELILADGTTGVVEGARGGENLKRLIFPDSVCYMGMGAFEDCRQLQVVTLPRQARQLRRCFWNLPGLRFIAQPPPALPESIWEEDREFTPLRLYQLGRTSPAAMKLIPDGYEVSPPRLHWKNGWCGEYWYALENSEELAYSLVLRLPSGQQVEQKTFSSYPFRKSTFTSRFLPFAYYSARPYLEACVDLIRQEGPPDPKRLEDMEAWWRTLVARRFWAWFDREKAGRRAGQQED